MRSAVSSESAAPAADHESRPAAPAFARDGWLAGLALAIAAADLLLKSWITGRVGPRETVSLIDGWVFLLNRHNTGIAFGLLDGSSEPWLTPLLIGVSLLGIAVIALLAHTSRSRAERFALALILGGALGNLVDRIADGAVTDFLLVRYFPFVFNLADAAITVGGIVFAVHLIRRELRS